MPNPTEFLKAQRKEAQAAARKEKVLRKRASREAMPWEERDEMIEREFRTMMRLPCWKKKLSFQRPTLVIRRSKGLGTSGHCKTWSREIVMTIGTRADRATIVELLLHELAHAAAGAGEGHGDKFRSILTEAVFEHTGAKVTEVPEAGAYDYDHQLVRAIRKTLPPSERAEYRAARAVKKRKPKGRPVGFPGELAVAIPARARDILDMTAHDLVGGGGVAWRKRREKGRWTFANKEAWMFAFDDLQHQAWVYSEGSYPEDRRDRQACLKGVERIREMLQEKKLL